MKINLVLTVDFREKYLVVNAEEKASLVPSDPSLAKERYKMVVSSNAKPDIGESIEIPMDGLCCKITDVKHVFEDGVLIPEVQCSIIRIKEEEKEIRSILLAAGFICIKIWSRN